jgi:hypothetical protein
MEAASRGDAIDSVELGAIKQRILNPSSGVSFTPRKKPRYSDDSWEFAGGGLDVLPSIEEAPDSSDPAALQEHIGRQWSTVITAVETLKSVAGRNNKYELELDALGSDIDSLRAAISRLTTLVGSPVDGLSFDLYGIMDRNEDAVMELDHRVTARVEPKLIELEAGLAVVQTEMQRFRDSTGDQLLVRLADLELSVKSMEASATPDALSGIVIQIRSSLVNDIFPAVRNLWTLFEMVTLGERNGTRLRCEAGGSYDVGHLLFQRLETMEKTGKDIVHRVQSLETGGISAPLHGSSVQSLTQRVLALERGRAQAYSGPARGGGPVGDLPGLFSDSRGSHRDSDSPRRGHGDGRASGGGGYGDEPPAPDPYMGPRLATVEAKIRDLEAQLDNMTVSMGGFSFKSVDDCEAFVIKHVPGNTFAFFYDLVSLLQRGWGHNHIGVREVWENSYAIKKAGFSSQGEAVILASMDTVLPTCLGELTGKNSECQLPLPALATHESWTSKGFQMGRRKDIQDGLLRVVTTIEDNIRDIFQGFEQGRCVVSEMLSLARTHWSQMERMIDTFYAEFLVTGTEKDAWKLTSLIAKTVFESVHQARAIGSDLSDLVSPSKRSAKVMWATLQAHRVMRTFINADFRNDPRIAPVIVLHLLENRVGRQDVDRLKVTLQTQCLQLIAQRRDIDKLITTVTELKRKAGGRGGGGGGGGDG